MISIRFTHATWFFIFGVIPFLSGCSGGELTKDQVLSTLTTRGRRLTVESENYVLQKGDQIEVTVPGYSDFHTTSNVDESGSINIPTIGIIHAGGETKAQLREQVKKKLSVYLKDAPVPIIKIKGEMEQKVIVLGSVTTQGSYTIPGAVSPLQVLALAGGPVSTADLRHVKIFRGDDETTEEIDISNSLATFTATVETLPNVNPGDLVYVPKEENVVRDFADLLRDVIVLFGIFSVVR
ncbi:MAG: polysaccharide biosynthesis/export family protein [Bacteroidota bacterium]